jgi:hypothetical protein
VSGKPPFEDRVRGGEGAVSLIKEPLDFSVDYAVLKAESATVRARRRWGMAQEEEAHER